MKEITVNYYPKTKKNCLSKLAPSLCFWPKAADSLSMAGQGFYPWERSGPHDLAWPSQPEFNSLQLRYAESHCLC